MARVLIVDDNESVRASVAALMFSYGHTASTAHDAAVAVEILEDKEPFDLIISDLNMPGMTGLELLGQVRNSKNPQKARTSFILYSASDQNLTQVCEDLGALYVQKGTRGLEIAIDAILGPAR